jgi:hypothetical protein
VNTVNIPYAPAVFQFITGGTAGALIMWLLGARKHTLEIAKLKLEIKRLTEDSEKQKVQNRTQSICDKIIFVAEEHQKEMRPGGIPLFTPEDFADALKEPLPEIMKALTVLESQGIADRKFAAGHWRIMI